MIKRSDWIAILKDRAAITLLLGVVTACLILIVAVVIRLHPSDIQIPVRYTGYGQTFIYRDQWYTQYSYVGFALIIMLINGFLAVRLYAMRRMLSLGLLSMSLLAAILAIIVVTAMFNLAPSL